VRVPRSHEDDAPDRRRAIRRRRALHGA
jgi:hypothetical protein